MKYKLNIEQLKKLKWIKPVSKFDYPKVGQIIRWRNEEEPITDLRAYDYGIVKNASDTYVQAYWWQIGKNRSEMGADLWIDTTASTGSFSGEPMYTIEVLKKKRENPTYEQLIRKMNEQA